jgi:hypothetical protein
MGYDMTEYDDSNNTHSATATVPSDGNYTVYFACIDLARNIGTTNTGSFAVDSTTPVIAFTAPTPSDNTFFNLNWAYINFTYTESNNDTVLVNFNSTNYTNAGITCSAASCSINITIPADGNYTYYAWINDTAANKAQTETRRIIIDTVAPNASITVNSGDRSTTSRTVTLSLSFNDTYGVRDCRLANEDRNFGVWEACVTYRTWQLTTGDATKTVILQVRDYANNTQETNDTISLDTTMPTTILRPLSNSIISGNQTIEVIAPDDARNVTFRINNGTDYKVDGTTGETNDTTAADGFAVSWNTTAFADGLYNLTAISYTASNNHISNDTETNITVDNTAPVLTNYTPTFDQYSKAFKVGINTTEESSCRYAFSDVSYSAMAYSMTKIADYAYEATATVTEDSSYTVYFACQDLAGNIGTNSTGFNVNSTAPVVISSGPDGSLNTPLVNLTVTTNRNANCRYNTSDANFTQMATSFTNTGGPVHNTTVTPTQGTNVYFVRCAVNSAGLNAMPYSVVIKFEYDAVAPSGTLNVNDSIVNSGSHILFTFEANELDLNVSINSSELQKLDSNGSLILLNDSGINGDKVADDATYSAVYAVSLNNSVADGVKEIVAVANDSANNVFRPRVNVTLDNTKPNATVIINDGDLYAGSRIVTLNMSFGDSAGVDKCRLANEDLNWTAWESCVTAKTWTLTSGAGVKTVVYQVRDSAGNINETNDTITVVLVPVSVAFASPTEADKAYFNKSWAFVNVSISNTTTIDTRVISFNNTNYTAGITADETFFYINITSLADGNYTYYAWANDSAGNTALTETRTIIIDTAAPNASITVLGTTPAGFTNVSTEYTVSRVVTLLLAYNDSAGVLACRYSNENRNWTAWESCTETKVWVLTEDDGNKTALYQVMDLAGNVNEANDTIFLNKTGAGLDITPPSAPTVVDDGKYTNTKHALHAKWNATDYESDLLRIPLEYEYRISYNDFSSYVNSSWIYAGTATEVTAYPLNLSDGENYTFEVRAINTANVTGSVGYSDGIIVDASNPAIPDVNGTNNGTWSSNNVVSFNFSSTDSVSGVKDYSYVLDTNSTTIPDEIAEAMGANTLLSSASNDGNHSVLKYNGTGTTATAFIEVTENLTKGDVLRVTFYAAESHYDTSEEMAVRVYAIDDNPSSQDESSNNITTIVDSSADRSYKASLRNADAYYADITAATTITDGNFYVAVSGLSSDNDNTYNLLLAASNTSVNKATQDYYCAASCTNMTNFFEYAVKVEQRSVKADNIWKRTYTVGDGVFYMHVRARDYANNWGATNHSVIRVDTSGPSTPQMTEPSRYTNTTSVTFNWTASTDIDSGVDNYYLEVSNTSDFTNVTSQGWVGNVTNATVTVSADRVYYARVRSRNLAGGNSSWSSSVSTVVDTTAPTIISSKPSGTVITSSPILTVETDEKAICKYMKGSSPYTNFSYTNRTYHETIVGADSGSNTFTVQCTDEIGNTRETSITFTVDTTATPSSITIYPTGGLSVFTESIARVDVIVKTSGNANLGEIPSTSFNLNLNNQQWPMSVKDNGAGNYSLMFTAPKTNGTYGLGVTVGSAVSSTYTLNVNYLLFTVAYRSAALSPTNKAKMSYVITSDYSIGVASDSSAVSVSSSATAVEVSADSNTGDVFVFVTRKAGDVERVEGLLKDKVFIDKVNPSFGYQIDEDKYIVYTSLQYADIALTGNETLETGRYSLIIENKGFDSSLNKTTLEVRVE